MANEIKPLHSIISVDNEDYSITAHKVANKLTVKVDGSEIAFDGSTPQDLTINIPTTLPANGGNADTVDNYHADAFVLKSEAAPADAEKNVQSDWNITDTSSDAFIKNKPTALKSPAALIIQGNGATTATYDGSTAKTVNIKGSGATSVTADANGNITISSTGGSGGGGTYLGTVSALTGLSTTANAGDFYRVATAFTFGAETAHVGDILIAVTDNPTQNSTGWDILHAESIASFSSIVVNGQSTVTADIANDALTLASGTSIAIKTDDTNDKVTIEHTTSGVTAGTYQSVTVTPQGHVTSGSTLISHGNTDPSTSTAGIYYFKY